MVLLYIFTCVHNTLFQKYDFHKTNVKYSYINKVNLNIYKFISL